MPISLRSRFKRLIPRSRTGWIGIDIGSHSLKLAQLHAVDDQLQFSEAAIVPYPDQATLTPDSLQTGWLAGVLRDELARHLGFRGPAAACGLSMSVTDFRSMRIPRGSHEERRQMISQELSEAANCKGEAFEFDFWDDCHDQTDSNNTAVANVVSVSTEFATQIAEQLQRAGLHCHVLDGGPFILARALEISENYKKDSKPVAVLDWGHRAAHFTVIADGQPVFSRVLKNCGVGQLTAAVSQGLGLSPDDGHELLSTWGVTDPTSRSTEQSEWQELVDELADESFNRVHAEIKKTMGFLRTQRPDLVPERLSLVGGGAAIRNTECKLGFDGGVTVSRWKLPQHESACLADVGVPVELLAQAAALSVLGMRS